MRKQRVVIFLTVLTAAFVFVSCGERFNGDQCDPTVIGFEEAELPAAGYELTEDNAYSEKDVRFSYTYEYFEEFDWTSWSGFVVSNRTDKETAGSVNQFSVYGNGGAANSGQFAVVYLPAEFSFGGSQPRELKYIYVNNSTYTYLSIKDGDKLATPFGEGDYFKLTVTGYDTGGKETGKVDFYLADFRQGKSFICKDWTRIDMSALGTVVKVDFSLETTKTNEYGSLTPSYFCLDNIAFSVPCI